MRLPAKPIIAGCLLAAAAGLFSGCVVVHYEDREGRKFDYSAPAFGTKAIDEVNLQTGTLKGYASKQTEMSEALGAGIGSGMRAMQKP